MTFIGILKRKFSDSHSAPSLSQAPVEYKNSFPLGVIPDSKLYIKRLELAGAIAKHEKLPWLYCRKVHIGYVLALCMVGITGLATVWAGYYVSFDPNYLKKKVDGWKEQE